jgi:gamma-glutamyltranspeptidase
MDLDGFYSGKTAELIVNQIKSDGGLHKFEDLKIINLSSELQF